jgi:hypothetical protein
MRDVCSADLLANPRQLGGPGHVVAIDESVVARGKTTANSHARPVPQQWVFGAVDLTTKDYILIPVMCYVMCKNNLIGLLTLCNVLHGFPDSFNAFSLSGCACLHL